MTITDREFSVIQKRAAYDPSLSDFAVRLLAILLDKCWDGDAKSEWSDPTSMRHLHKVCALPVSRTTFNVALQCLISRGYIEMGPISRYRLIIRPATRLSLVAHARVSPELDNSAAGDVALESSESSREESTSSTSGRQLSPELDIARKVSPKLDNLLPLTPEQAEVARLLQRAGIGNPTREILARMSHMTRDFVEGHIRLVRATPRLGTGILVNRLRDADPLPFVCPVCGSAEDRPHHFLSGNDGLFACPFEDGYNTEAEVEEAFGPFQVMGRR